MGHSLNIPWTEPSDLHGSVGEWEDRPSTFPPTWLRRAERQRQAERLGMRAFNKYPIPEITREVLEERRCLAISNKTLQRCGCHAMRGAMFCLTHGGRMGRDAAKKRLEEMCEPAIAVLKDLMHEGCEDEVRLKAAIAVLDRAGYSPKMQLTVKDKREGVDGLSREELFARGRAIAAELERRRTKISDVSIEAEVVQSQELVPR